jgi:hypothetical protein
MCLGFVNRYEDTGTWFAIVTRFPVFEAKYFYKFILTYLSTHPIIQPHSEPNTFEYKKPS